MKHQLSILIPIYNNDCREQVEALSTQAQAIENLEFEIVVADDGSDEGLLRTVTNRPEPSTDLSQTWQHLPGVRYIRRKHNVGRAAIRNFLAREARYEWLLFMDGDMSIPSNNFVKQWVEANTGQLAYGGYIVGSGESSSLRYLYEKQCEPMHRAEERRKRPFQHFHTCNFMIQRELMLSHPFDERFRHYGYEDVLFGKQLRAAGASICHIDNPAGFFDFEDNAHFVSKTEEGLRTLNEFRTDLRGYSQMLTFVDGIHVGIVKWIFIIWHRLFGEAERRNLCGKKPSLKLFKLYRLGYFLTIERKNDK